MPGSANLIGMEAVWENANFNRGQAEYVRGLAAAVGAGEQFSKQTNNMAGGSSMAATAIGTLQQAAQGGTAGIMQLGAGLAAGALGVVGLVNAIVNGVKQIVGMGMEALTAASRVKQLNIIAQVLGKNVGTTSGEINNFIARLNEAGVSQSVASQTAADAVRANIKLGDAVQLVKVAQDAATIAGIGTSQAMEGIMNSVRLGNTSFLKFYGIITGVKEQEDKYVETLKAEAAGIRDVAVAKAQSEGDTKAATEAEDAYAKSMATTAGSLTVVQKILASGPSIAGAYKESMLTAGKVMGSFTSRIMPDLMVTLGMPFQNAFYNAAKGVSDLVQAFTLMISEGGVLFPIITGLGAAVDLLTTPFKNLGETLLKTAKNIQSGVSDPLMESAQNALSWGMNLATNFAQGMMDGAASAITAAVNWISSMLSGWFAPGSPPKILPDIDMWGADTMGEWLNGMTTADFSILESVQGNISAAFGALTKSGVMTTEGAAAKLEEISKQMMDTLASGAKLDDKFFEDLAASAGEYGSTIVNITKMQLAQADSEQAIVDAENALIAARKKGMEQAGKVNKGMMEYNQLVRSGASKDVLKAKLAEIEAAKKGVVTAATEITDAETKLTLAHENAQALQEQIALQQKVLEQLMKFADLADKEQPKPPGGGGGGSAPGGPPKPPEPPDTSGITDAMATAIEDAKKKMMASLTYLWNWIQVQWFLTVLRLEKKWDEFGTYVAGIWQKVADYFDLPSWESVKAAWLAATKWIVKQVLWMGKTLETWWTNHGGNVVKTVQGFWKTLIKVFEGAGKLIALWLKTKLDVLRGMWSRWGTDITTALAGGWENIKKLFTNALELIGISFAIWAKIFEGDWAGAWDGIKKFFELWLTNLKLLFQSLWDGLVVIVTVAGKQLWWEVTNIWTVITTAITDALTGIQTWMTTTWTAIQLGWSAFWTLIYDTSADLILKVQTKITAVFTEIQTWLSATWTSISTTVTTTWTSILTTVTTQITAIQTSLATTMATMKTNWDTFWTDVSTKLSEIWDAIVVNVTAYLTGPNGIFTFISATISGYLETWNTNWNLLSTALMTWWDNLILGVTEKFTGKGGVVDSIKTNFDTMISQLSEYVTVFYTLGSNFIGGMVDGVLGAVGNLITAVTTAIADAIAAAEAALTGKQPPTPTSAKPTPEPVVTYPGGPPLPEAEGKAEGGPVTTRGSYLVGEKGPELFVPSMAGTVIPNNLLQSAAVPIISGGTSNQMTINITIPTTITDKMNQAQWEGFVIRTIKKAITVG